MRVANWRSDGNGRAARRAQAARERGHDIVAMSRSTGVDLSTGAGLAEALEGVDMVIDVTNAPTFEEAPATEFFT